MAKNFLWVTNTEENVRFYSNSAAKSNLSLRFASAINKDTKKRICDFVRYLRKVFYFPIRCNIYFCIQEKFESPKGGYSYGIFYSNEESGGRVYPQIYIPARMDFFSVCHSLSHELTHYFQWYFLEDNQKSDRAIEREVSRYATRIMEDYCSRYCREPDNACEACREKR